MSRDQIRNQNPTSFFGFILGSRVNKMADDQVRIRGRFCKKTKAKRSALATHRNTHPNISTVSEHNYATPTSPVVLPISPVVPVEDVAVNIDITGEADELHWTQGRRMVELSVLAEQLFATNAMSHFILGIQSVKSG